MYITVEERVAYLYHVEIHVTEVGHPFLYISLDPLSTIPTRIKGDIIMLMTQRVMTH